MSDWGASLGGRESFNRHGSDALLFISRLAGLAVLAIYAPALATIAALILLTSTGPALVKRAYRRTNGSGDLLYLYEFRTECWKTWQPTVVGCCVKRLDMHRLPRLINVLAGEVLAGERVEPVRG